MASESNQNVVETAVRCLNKRWPPDFSSLSGLGFDKVSVSQCKATVRSVQGSDLSGRPHIFEEIEFRKGAILVRYSLNRGADPAIRRMCASLLLLRCLRLVPAAEAEPQSLAEFLLPSFELACGIADQGYEALHKERSDLRQDAEEASAKARRLLFASEENASRTLELEAALSSAQERVRRLESVSDATLREMALEWLSLHRGEFSIVQFASSHGISPARAEEGLEMLLKEGSIRRIGAGRHAILASKPQQFERIKSGLQSSLKGSMHGAAAAAGMLFQKRK